MLNSMVRMWNASTVVAKEKGKIYFEVETSNLQNTLIRPSHKQNGMVALDHHLHEGYYSTVSYFTCYKSAVLL